MKKQFYTKLLFLFALLLTVSTSAWAETVTFDFSEKDYGWHRHSSGSATQGVTPAAVEDVITCEPTLDDKSKAALFTGHLRLYTGSTLTISTSSGFITEIVVTCTGNGTSSYGPGKLSGEGYVASSGKTGTWSGNDTSVTLNATAQSRVVSVEVTYTPAVTGKDDCDLALTPNALNFDLYNDKEAKVINYTTSSTGAVTVSGSEYVTAEVNQTAKTITVTPLKRTPSAQITVSQAADDNYNEGGTTFTVSITDSTPKTGKWELTDLADLTADDVFVIVGNNGSNYAMSNNNGTSSAPSAIAVTINNDEITSDVDDNIKWNISGNATEGYTFYPAGTTSTWLYCTNTNNGVRVGDGEAKNFAIHSSGYLYTSQTTDTRYLGIYNSQDWRCYTNTTGNTKDQTFAFFKYVSLSPLASIAVTGAPTTFHKGDAFSHEGAVVTATYEDGTTKIVTGKATFTGYDMNVEGEQTVTVSYNGKTATYTINVNAPAVLTGISLSGNCPTEFEQGDDFSHDGLVVTANYDDGNSAVVTNEAEFSGYNMSALGEQTVTVSYQGQTVTYNITIVEKKGTAENPYTVAQARAAIDAGKNVNGVYATGIVSEIVTAYSTQYKNISYNISVDGEPTGDQLQAFRGKNFKGANFTSDNDIKVGDKVVIYGNLTTYDSTYEFAAANQLVSLERANFITDAANATWVAPAKVKVLSEGVQVYTVTYDDAVRCTRKHVVADKVIPANEAVLLTSSNGEAATVKIAVTDDEAAAYADLKNDLQGSDGTVWGDTNIFCLADGAKGLGFYPVDSSIQVPAGKAYLLIPSTQAAPSYIWFNGDTTAIDSLTTDTAADNESGEIYSLTGQRVGKNYRGIVIMNGRKVLKK